jgi:hypothetical protein
MLAAAAQNRTIAAKTSRKGSMYVTFFVGRFSATGGSDDRSVSAQRAAADLRQASVYAVSQ